MADENTVSVKAELDLSDWTPNQKQLEAALAHVNSIIDGSAKKAEENSKRIAEAEKQAADAQKKAASEAEKAAKAEEAAANKRERSLRKFAISAAIVTAAVVKSYQMMRDAATELGDTEAVAQFEAMDATLGTLRDTVLQTGLEILKASEAIPFLTDKLQTLYQIAIIVSNALVGFTIQVAALAKAGKGYGIEDLGKPGVLEELNAIDFAAIQAQAQDAQRKALAGIVAAPSSRKQVDTEKEANKQREKTAQNIVDYNAKIRELTIKSGESILEAEKDYHAKSAEAWSSYMDEVADITAKGISKRAELAREYSDKIASAETDYQRAIEDANYQHDKKLVDIERDYQRTIQSIQQTYQEDSLDAIRNLDAIALIRAKEKRDKDLANAETSRNDANAAEGENYTRQLYEAQRAFEDKRREAEIAYQRGLEEQKRAEAEALQEAKNAYNQQTTDARNAYNEKLRTIQQAYNNENAAASAQYGYSEAAYRDHLQRMQAITAAYGIGAATSTRGTGTLHRRQGGGLDIVSSPTQFLAGEAGPEMVYTAPLNRSVPISTPQIIEHTGDFQHSIDSTIRSSVAGMDGRIVAAVSKVLREVLG